MNCALRIVNVSERFMSDAVVQALVNTGKWSESTARLAHRAGFRCEYCDLDLLASVTAYKLFEVDHIVPTSKGGDIADPENLALSCRHCNFYFKRSWDPRSSIDERPPRDELILRVRNYLAGIKQRRLSDLNEVRMILGRAAVAS